MELLVNEKPRRVDCHTDDTLLHVLRNILDLAGTRFGCGAEACGACMVMVDGSPAFSCTTRAADMSNKAVVTVEGLPEFDMLKQAFMSEQAGQCGYCLSGILISSAALLRSNRQPDRAAVIAALDRHLCRCGAHNRIVRAVLLAADALRGDA